VRSKCVSAVLQRISHVNFRNLKSQEKDETKPEPLVARSCLRDPEFKSKSTSLIMINRIHFVGTFFTNYLEIGQMKKLKWP
jgi:hypothetical protein